MKHNWLLFLLAAAILSGCGDETGKPTTDDTASSSTAVSEIVTEPSDVDSHAVPESDYAGESFDILYASGGLYIAHERFFFAEEATGEVLNDAIYERNLAVEEALNIDINGVTFGYIDTIYPKIRQDVQAGDNAFDLALTHTYAGITSMISERLVYDWNDVPYVDLTKNYWNQNMNQTLTVNGVLPVASSDYMPADTYMILYNKKLHKDYQLEDYNALVRDGKWTLERFTGEVNKISSDLNGDGVYDVNDQYGLAAMLDANFQGFLNACDLYAVGLTDEGLTITQPDDRFVHMIEVLNGLLYYNQSVYYWKMADHGTEKALDFSSDRALFTIVDINSIETFRNMETDFGILPLPKYDEAQENYRSLSMSGFITVPQSTADVELSGKAAELLSHYSAEIFTPAYYDLLLDSKVARDEESSEMLDIIFDSIVFDYGMVYGGYNEISYSLMQILMKKDTAIASYFEKNTKRVQKNIYDKVYKAFVEFGEED
ncbi:MAG: hypothetical protein E7604_07055 [Ruminococcaceae bacterium]|nr:hypothetical protein [Oscillospiraceae bacterium]